MITAVDTNILLDVFGADPEHGQRSKKTIRKCLQDGALVACEVVWAEVAAFFPSSDLAHDSMARLGLQYSPMRLEATLLAGDLWRNYRRRGGAKTRVVADFLIGSHALTQCERLLSRDRGFYRGYFQNLKVVDSSPA